MRARVCGMKRGLFSDGNLWKGIINIICSYQDSLFDLVGLQDDNRFTQIVFGPKLYSSQNGFCKMLISE